MSFGAFYAYYLLFLIIKCFICKPGDWGVRVAAAAAIGKLCMHTEPGDMTIPTRVLNLLSDPDYGVGTRIHLKPETRNEIAHFQLTSLDIGSRNKSR